MGAKSTNAPLRIGSNIPFAIPGLIHPTVIDGDVDVARLNESSLDHGCHRAFNQVLAYAVIRMLPAVDGAFEPLP